jgi:hypothetical protein
MCIPLKRRRAVNTLSKKTRRRKNRAAGRGLLNFVLQNCRSSRAAANSWSLEMLNRHHWQKTRRQKINQGKGEIINPNATSGRIVARLVFSRRGTR